MMYLKPVHRLLTALAWQATVRTLYFSPMALVARVIHFIGTQDEFDFVLRDELLVSLALSGDRSCRRRK